MTNYQTAIKRINAAQTFDEIGRLTRSVTNIYEAGFFTETELMRLDIKLLDRIDTINNTNRG